MSTINLATIDFCPGGGGAILQQKTAEMLLTETSKVIEPDSGYSGISRLTVTHAPVETVTSVSYSANGTYTITPDSGYDATMQVNATVSIPQRGVWFLIYPMSYTNTLSASTVGYDYISSIYLESVTYKCDELAIQAGNIRSGVSIIGVTGTVEGTVISGTLSVTSDGLYDVVSYESININGSVPVGLFISLPNCTSLDYLTFTDCPTLVEITLPVCTSIGDYTFSGCTSLTTFTINTSNATAGTSIFYNCPNLASIYVPSDALTYYQTTTGWSEYSSIIIPII